MDKFIVCGVPRSGTTALASLLNWQPNVFCGIERFPLATVDQSFFTREGVNDEAIPTAHYAWNVKTLKEKAQVDAIGDKGPRYFYRLPGSHQAFSNVRLIFIIRNIGDVFRSWNQRAHNPEDGSWHRGQTGIFAYLDFLQLLYTLDKIRNRHESIVLSYEKLFFGETVQQYKLINQVFSFLGVSASGDVFEGFEAESAKRHSLQQKKTNLSEPEIELIKTIRLAPIFNVLQEHEGILTPEKLATVTGALLNDFLQRRKEILRAVDELLLPGSGISQAMTVMRYCYQLSGSNNIWSDFKNKLRDDSANFELLANLFNAIQKKRHQEASSVGRNLLDRFPECPELLIEMSQISNRLGDGKNSIAYTERAMALQPGNEALFQHLQSLKRKFGIPVSSEQEPAQNLAPGQVKKSEKARGHDEPALRSRIEIIREGLNLSGTGLEIGPLCTPIVRKAESAVYYLDHMDKQGLRDKYKNHPEIDIDQIIDVDFVLREQGLRDSLPEGMRFDYVIASHVIEHVPDLVGYLRRIKEILNPGAVVSLAVPDKRYCFDLLKIESAIGEILHAFYNKQIRPSFLQVFYHMSKVVPITAPEAWSGSVELQPIRSIGEAYDIACRSQNPGAYTDVHCWTFTPESFVEVIRQLRELKLIDFEISSMTATRPNTNEFYVQLAQP